MLKMARLTAVTVLILSYSLFSYAQGHVFNNGDEVCFVGNSITNHAHFYHDIDLFYATRFPTQKITVVNCGVSGNTAANVINRLDGDVLAYHPNWAILMLGMNDVHKELYTKQASAMPDIAEKRKAVFDIYKRDYQVIIQSLLKNNSKVILQTPTVFDQTAYIPNNDRLTGRNDALKMYAGFVKELGKKYGFEVIDYWTIMNGITQKIQAVDSAATIIGPDRVHPGPVGHFIMAYQFLKTTKAQAYISKISLSAGKTKAPQPLLNVAISNVKGSQTGISFTCLENSLPYPFPQGTEPALKLIDFVNDLDHEDLKIRDLHAGKYQLKIDGAMVGTYTANELQAGINMAQNKITPQYQQALKVLHLFEEYWKLEAKIRYIKGMEFGRMGAKNNDFTYADAESYFAKATKAMKDTTTANYKNFMGFKKQYLTGKVQQAEMDARMLAIHNEVYKVNQPVPHQFEITKI